MTGEKLRHSKISLIIYEDEDGKLKHDLTAYHSEIEENKAGYKALITYVTDWYNNRITILNMEFITTKYDNRDFIEGLIKTLKQMDTDRILGEFLECDNVLALLDKFLRYIRHIYRITGRYAEGIQIQLFKPKSELNQSTLTIMLY